MGIFVIHPVPRSTEGPEVTKHKALVDQEKNHEKGGHVFDRLAYQRQDKLEALVESELVQERNPRNYRRKRLNVCGVNWTDFAVFLKHDEGEKTDQPHQLNDIPEVEESPDFSVPLTF